MKYLWVLGIFNQYNWKLFHTMKKNIEAQIRVISDLSQPKENLRISPQT